MKIQEGTISALNGRKATSGVPHQAATGVILFSSTGHLLFMNHDAQRLLGPLQPCATIENGSCLIPSEINALVRELISRLIRYEHPKDCEHIQIERLSFNRDQRLLLRGLCIPDEPLARNSRVLVILEKLTPRVEYPGENIQQRYHLTEREQMVIIYLMLGFTNKEIANRLNLSEYTVKEHLKRIMQKTKTTTRTGLLARMIFPAPQIVGSSFDAGAEPDELVNDSPPKAVTAVV